MSDVEPREEVVWFSRQMELALRRNDPKFGTHGWLNSSIEDLLISLEEHILKLRRRQLNVSDAQQLVYDVTDIANYAMMIADLAAALQKNDKFIRNIDERLADICADRVIGAKDLAPNLEDEQKQRADRLRKKIDGIVRGESVQQKTPRDLTEEAAESARHDGEHARCPAIIDDWCYTCAEIEAAEIEAMRPPYKPGPPIQPKPLEEQDLSPYTQEQPWHVSDEEFEKMTGAKFTVIDKRPPEKE